MKSGKEYRWKKHDSVTVSGNRWYRHSQEHAQTLAYMERDLADGVAEAVFQDTEIFRGGFPELTDRLAGLLDDTDFLTDLNERLSALGEGYVEDKDLMRMHFYKPDKVAALFQQFAKPYQNFAARDGFHWNEYKKFITEDEINAFFTRGSNYSDSRLAIYSFFLNHEDKKERANFLKDHYGIGGSSHAQTKYFRREEYLPVNTIVELDDREFRVDSINFEQGTVSLQDMTLAKEARYPIFRTEPLEYIRHLYEQVDVPMEEAVEITVFTALHNAGVAYEDFSRSRWM